MKKYLILGAAALLAACSLTAEERESLRGGVKDTLLLAIEEVRAIGVDATIEVDEDVLKGVRVVCRLANIGSPLLTSGINILVDRYNEDAETPTERVTAVEFRGHVEAGCSVVDELLAESPAPATAPQPTANPAT